MGAACTHVVTHVLYLQQPQPLLIVEPFHSCPEPANHYVVVMVTCGDDRWWCMSQMNNKGGLAPPVPRCAPEPSVSLRLRCDLSFLFFFSLNGLCCLIFNNRSSISVDSSIKRPSHWVMAQRQLELSRLPAAAGRCSTALARPLNSPLMWSL